MPNEDEFGVARSVDGALWVIVTVLQAALADDCPIFIPSWFLVAIHLCLFLILSLTELIMINM